MFYLTDEEVREKMLDWNWSITVADESMDKFKVKTEDLEEIYRVCVRDSELHSMLFDYVGISGIIMSQLKYFHVFNVEEKTILVLGFLSEWDAVTKKSFDKCLLDPGEESPTQSVGQLLENNFLQLEIRSKFLSYFQRMTFSTLYESEEELELETAKEEMEKELEKPVEELVLICDNFNSYTYKKDSLGSGLSDFKLPLIIASEDKTDTLTIDPHMIAYAVSGYKPEEKENILKSLARNFFRQKPKEIKCKEMNNKERKKRKTKNKLAKRNRKRT